MHRKQPRAALLPKCSAWRHRDVFGWQPVLNSSWGYSVLNSLPRSSVKRCPIQVYAAAAAQQLTSHPYYSLEGGYLDEPIEFVCQIAASSPTEACQWAFFAACQTPFPWPRRVGYDVDAGVAGSELGSPRWMKQATATRRGR